MKRVNFEGPGDSPDEYYFECGDCEGDGGVHIPDLEDEGLVIPAECPNCDGKGYIEGDADDVED